MKTLTLPCIVLAETVDGATIRIADCMATLPWSGIVSLTQVVRESNGRIVDEYAKVELTPAVAAQHFDCWAQDFPAVQ